MKSRTSKISLKGENISTAALTVIISVGLIVGLFIVSIVALYRHRLVAAAMSAAALFATLHVVFVMAAWSEKASACFDAHLTMRWGGVSGVARGVVAANSDV